VKCFYKVDFGYLFLSLHKSEERKKKVYVSVTDVLPPVFCLKPTLSH